MSSPLAARTGRELAFFFILAILFFIPGLNRGLIFDEFKTRMVADLPWPDLIQERLGAGHLPTYFMMVKAWLATVPYSNWEMRLPGMIMGALAVIPFYMFGLRIRGRSAARWIALIYITHQLVLWDAQAARPYGALMMFEGLTAWAVAEWWAGSRKLWLGVIGLGALGGIMMMPLAALGTAALLIGLVASWRIAPRRAWPAMASMILAMAIGFIPALMVASSQSKLSVERQWQAPNFLKLTNALADMTYGDYSLWARGIMKYIAEAVCVGAFFITWKSWRRNHITSEEVALELPWRRWVLCWIFFPLVVLVMVSAFTGEAMVTHSRYQSPALGGMLVLLGTALVDLRSRIQPRAVRLAVTLLLIFPLVASAVAWQRSPGEGVDHVASAMIRNSSGHLPAQVAGHVRWLRLELPGGRVPDRELFIERRPVAINTRLIEAARASGHDVQVMDYDKSDKDVKELTEAIGKWAGGKPFWLFVYIQQPDALDVLAKHPPVGFQLEKKVKKGFARAYLFTPH